MRSNQKDYKLLHVFVLLFRMDGFHFWKLLLQAARPSAGGFPSHLPVKQLNRPASSQVTALRKRGREEVEPLHPALTRGGARGGAKPRVYGAH